jgi:hypothetical protein
MADSETAKYRHLTAQYCQGTPGVDIGSSGDPVVAHAIQIDLEQPYCPPLGPGPIHLRGDGSNLSLWFQPESLAFVYSSHLFEDFNTYEQEAVMADWMSRVRAGGHLIILMPDKGRWQAALAKGQPPNLAHKHEGTPGELTRMLRRLCSEFGVLWEILMDECPDPNDYGIVFIARRL